MKATPLINNFTSGEWSPLLEGRSDLEQYSHSAKKIENILVMPYGGVTKIPGTRYVAEVKNSAKKVRLIPFEFNVSQAYMLEFGNEYIRFYMNQGQLVSVDSATKLLLHGDGLDGSKNIVDSGYTGHTVTANGNCQIDTSWSEFGTGSILFPGGVGDYVSIPDHADWFAGAGRFTFDCWVKHNVLPTSSEMHYFFCQYLDATHWAGFSLLYTTGLGYTLGFAIYDGIQIVNVAKSCSPPIIGTPYHLALIRGWGGNVNDYAICVNGKILGTPETDDSAWPDYSGASMYLGWKGTAAEMLRANLDEVRWSLGEARWEANFSPPTIEYPQAQGGTPYEIASPYLEAHLPQIQFVQEADVMYLVHPSYNPKKLSRAEHTSWSLEDYIPEGVPDELISLLHFNGEDTSTEITDETGNHVYTAQGTAQIDTAWKKWGSGSLLLNGTTDYVTAPDHADWDFVKSAVGDRTIHFWIKHDDHVGSEYYISHGASATARWYLRHLHGSGLNFFAYTGMAQWIDTGYGAEITDTNEHHIALIKRGNEYGIYLDGAQTAYAISNNTADTTGALHIGVDAQGVTQFFDGHMDELHNWKENIFNAHPMSDLSDTIEVPTGEHAANPFGSANNYPSAVTFFEQRLVFAGTNNKPQTFWASASGNYESMIMGSEDDDAMEFTIASPQVDVIRWVYGDVFLFAGTSGGVYNIGSGSPTIPLTPTNIAVRKHTNFGCNGIPPVKMGNYLYYVQRNNLNLREYVYEYTRETYRATDATLLAEHVLKPKVIATAYQQSPYNLLYCVRSDGEVAIFTRNLIQEVMGWARLSDSGEVESVAVIPRAIGGDEVWFAFKRGTKRYVEYLEDFSFDALEDAFFVRSGLSYSGAPITVVSGLDHLNGEEVTILGDGAVFPNQTVTSNEITLSKACSKIQVGLPYEVKLILQKLEYGTALGTAQGKVQRISRLAVKFYRTLGCSIGVEGKKDILSFRSTGMEMDGPPDLFTGDKVMTFPKGYDRNINILVWQNEPLPLTLLSMVAFGETHEA